MNIRICALTRRYPFDFKEPAQFAGGEHIILIRAALLSYNTLTKETLKEDKWFVLPQKTEGENFVGAPMDAAPLFEQKLLEDTSKYPIKEYANYKAVVALLKAQFLRAQEASDKCKAEASTKDDQEHKDRYESYANSFQAAALLFADALDSLQVHGR